VEPEFVIPLSPTLSRVIAQVHSPFLDPRDQPEQPADQPDPRDHPRIWERYPRATAILLVAVALLGDYATGPFILFPILFTVPVIFTAWYLERMWALALALLMPLVRFSFDLSWDVRWDVSYTVVNMVIRTFVFTALGWLTHSLAAHVRALEMEVRVLKGIVPICSFCRRIRTGEGSWQPLESFLADHSEAQFSHGFCEDCGREQYGDLLT